ncbi:hypothetical protein ACWDU3_30775 [Streptomyces olivaceus]|uniref:hypothetical protein n=1 Tax=Streptomyces olivaceus TaxID=47716 RepID=UPI00368461AE
MASPLPDGTRSMLLTCPAADRDEATRLVVVAREAFPAQDASVTVLRAPRTLVAFWTADTPTTASRPRRSRCASDSENDAGPTLRPSPAALCGGFTPFPHAGRAVES